jgi:hypothetical protein
VLVVPAVPDMTCCHNSSSSSSNASVSSHTPSPPLSDCNQFELINPHEERAMSQQQRPHDQPRSVFLIGARIW